MPKNILRRQFHVGLVCLLLCSCCVTAGHKEKLCELAKTGQLSDELILEYYQYAIDNAKEKIPAPDEFWDWLSRNKRIEQGLMVGLHPEYNPHVVTNLQELRKDFGTKVEQYPHLALAFSFVYGAAKGETIRGRWMRWVSKNRPVPSCSDSFAYYVNNKDKMLSPLDKLPWPLMLYVANNDVPLGERQWALSHYAGRSIKSLKKIYADPKYVRGANIAIRGKLDGVPMALSRILSDGGTCGQEAYYASRVIKCFGVPSVALLGFRHAYEGHVVQNDGLKTQITMASGRKFGYVLCPLTRTKLREYEFKLLVSAIDHSYVRYLKSKIACHVFRMLPDDSKKKAVGLLEAAMKNNSYVLDPWREYTQLCEDGVLPLEIGWELFNRANSRFPNHPEVACSILHKLTLAQLNTNSEIPNDQYLQTRKYFMETLRRINKKNRLDLGYYLIFKSHSRYLLQAKGVDSVVENSLQWLKSEKLKLNHGSNLFKNLHTLVAKSKDMKALEKLISSEYRRRLLLVRKCDDKTHGTRLNLYKQVANAYISFFKKSGELKEASKIQLELDNFRNGNAKLTDLRDVIRQGRALGAIDEQVTNVAVAGEGCHVWRILYDLPKGTNVRLRTEHAATGKEGAFCFTAWADKDGDGVPDTQIDISPLMMVKNKGEWSDWEFASDGKTVFVGTAMKKKTPIHYQMGGELEGYYGLSDRVFYSRKFGQPPISSTQPRYTNMRVEILGR